MKFDLNVLWIDDSEDWLLKTMDILLMHLTVAGLNINFEFDTNANSILNAIENQKDGFHKFDVFMVDYTLSEGIKGNEIIEKLKLSSIDADIIFYSADGEKEIRKIISDSFGNYEGVYVANRETFIDKALRVIKKNSRKLTNLANVRGFLTEQAAENDFSINSIIDYYIDKLTDDKKETVLRFLIEKLEQQKNKTDEEIDLLISRFTSFIFEINAEPKKTTNIAKSLKKHRTLISLRTRYELAKMLVDGTDTEFDNEFVVGDYFKQVVNYRNILAHKKILVCKKNKYLIYFDDINEMSKMKCPSDCSLHNNKNRLSITEWDKLRTDSLKYSKILDEVNNTIEKEGYEEIKRGELIANK